MAVDFMGDTWKHVEAHVKRAIDNNQSITTSTDKTYKDILRAQGAILALKSILNMPQNAAAIRKQ